MIKLYHFLGGMTFALILITLTALLVLLGTLLESSSGSHLYAASLTYDHPVFNLFLAGFFLNILFSATRRWPFRKKHIPFLLTHLGLLMVISGTILKNFYGKQGTMHIIEGAASQTLFLPNTYALSAETRTEKRLIPLATNRQFLPDLKDVKIVQHIPHAISSLSTWIKDNHVDVKGFPLKQVVALEDLDLKAAELSLLHWNIVGVKAKNAAEVVDKIFQQIFTLKLIKTSTDEVLYSGPFVPKLTIPPHSVFMQLELNDPAFMTIQLPKERLIVPLAGKEALTCTSETNPWQGASPLQVDLSGKPLLVFIQDPENQVWLVALDAYGRLHQQDISPHKLEAYFSHDEGFQGYSTELTVPLSLAPTNRQNEEAARVKTLEDALVKAKLLPPWNLLKESCKKAGLSFSATSLNFLKTWHNSRQLVPSGQKLGFAIDRSLISPQDYKTCCWMVALYRELEKELLNARDPVKWLRDKNWPFIAQLETLNEGNGNLVPQKVELFLDLIAKQIYATTHILPEKDEQDDAALLGAYMRLYGIHYTQLISQIQAIDYKQDGFTLQTSIKSSIQPQIAFKQLEKNKPAITLLLSDGQTQETISLPFEDYGQGLKWGVMKGAYLVRFQPETLEIPFRVRLRNARQINYATSNSAASFESNLMIKDTRHDDEVEVTLSMNHVYETWDGWRFYLSNIFPDNDTEIHQIQLIVNFDPVKYSLTYPGAAIMSCGILLLFWLKPYRKD